MISLIFDLRSQRRKLKSDHEKQKDPKENILQRYTLAQSLLYFVDMGKDFLDTLSPYKTKGHVYRDLFQLFYGLKNTFIGIGGFMLTIGVVILDFILIPLDSDSTLKGSLFRQGANFLGSFGQILRGVTQIVTSPFSILRTIPRGLLTKDKEWEAFQDRKSIVNLVKCADTILDENGSIGSMRIILDQLIRKAKSNTIKKQYSHHALRTETENWPFGETGTCYILPLQTEHFFPRWIKLQKQLFREQDPMSSKQKSDVTAYLQSFRKI